MTSQFSVNFIYTEIVIPYSYHILTNSSNWFSTDLTMPNMVRCSSATFCSGGFRNSVFCRAGVFYFSELAFSASSTLVFAGSGESRL